MCYSNRSSISFAFTAPGFRKARETLIYLVDGNPLGAWYASLAKWLRHKKHAVSGTDVVLDVHTAAMWRATAGDADCQQ